MEQVNKPVSVEQWSDIRELALMSIGTNKGSWWADPGFGSELWLLKKTGKVDGETAGTLERMVREALRWLVDESLVSTVECAARRNGANRIDYLVTINRPAGAPVIIQEAWSAI